MITAVIGAGGGVGAPSFALLLSVTVRESRRDVTEVVFVEADRTGGVVGARFDLGVESGVSSWISGLAADPTTPVGRFGRLVTDGLRVLPGPVGWPDAEKVFSGQAVDLLTKAMTDDDDRWWVADLGCGGSTMTSMVAAADALVVVCPGAAEYVVRLPALVSWARPVPCVVMLAGSSPWPADEVRGHCSADAVLEAPSLNLSAGEVVDLIGGRRRRRSRAWAAVLAGRDAAISAAANAEQPERTMS